MPEAATLAKPKPSISPPAAVAEEPDRPKVRRLAEARFREAAQVRREWNVVPEEGTPFEAVLNPVFWVHNARKMRPTDLIEVMPDDASYYARLLVRSVGPLGVEVAKLEYYDLVPQAQSLAAIDRFRVMWKGPHWKHTVIRLEDKKEMQTGFDTAEAAQKWLVENQRSLMTQKAA